MAFFSGLSIYTVHLRPTDIGRPDKIRFVREGLCFNAVMWGGLWALTHGLWRAALCLCALYVVLGALAHAGSLDPTSTFILALGIQLCFGFSAHDLLRTRLTRKGYVMTALVSGENRMRAEQRFFDRHASYLAHA